jgi:hypothetical protein
VVEQHTEDMAYSAVVLCAVHTVDPATEVAADKAVVAAHHSSCYLDLLHTGELELVGEHSE